MKKFAKVSAVIFGIIVIFLVYVQFSYEQKFEAPVTGIKSSTDSTVVARGEYLVLGISHCYACHTNDSLRAIKAKEPMMGGNVYETPFGDFNIPNITSDETGIGTFTDEQLAQSIRYNVNHRNEAMAGFMSYNKMSDEDIGAIISYLRSTKPVRHNVKKNDLNMLGKILRRFAIKPVSNPEPDTVKPDSTAAYGKYLAYTLGQCNSCHTRRDKIGRFVGKPFAGGFVWKLPDGTYTSANLTPDDSTGRITHWSEELFVQRFRTGRVMENSPMPWEAYEKINDRDLKALYRYFNSLEAVKNKEAAITYIP